ncbi:CNT_collapsed_G0059730.mRNA.1.CDS.1 [Saccharomyces cerevisiae]|nr:CNT_collapsed_G0059730.mRNA.1.CDS.1 [Saccharomyces cerevisiae]
MGVSIPLTVGMIANDDSPDLQSFLGVYSQVLLQELYKEATSPLVILNWVIGPLLMTALAWMALFDYKGIPSRHYYDRSS